MDTTKMAVAVFDKCADSYQHKYMDTHLYHDTFDVFCSYLEQEDAAILEVACGPGNITKYLLLGHPAYRLLATDLAPNMLALAAANNPTATFRLMDARDISTLDRKFDGIMCGFCFPYLSKEQAIQFIHDAAGLLRANGMLYISTMEDDYSKSGIQAASSGDQLYIYFHEAGHLTNALEEHGFTIADLQRKITVDTAGTKTTDLIVIATKISRF